MFKSVRFWIGLAISVACLYLAFQGIQFDKLLDALKGMNYTWLIAGIALWCVSYTGRVLRWQLLFLPRKMRIAKIFSALNIGYFLSNILPARLGDLIRAYLIGDMEGVSKAQALSTVVVERLSDGLTVVLLLAVTAVYVPNIPSQAREGAIGVAATGVAGILVLLLLTLQKERGLALLHKLAAPFGFLQRPGLWSSLESLIDGFAVLRSPRTMLGVAVAALYAWVLGGVVFWMAMNAVGLRDPSGAVMPLAAAFLVMTVTSLVVIIPSSPGYVGVFHYVAVLTLTSVYNVDKSNALSYAVVIHALSYLMLTALGLFSIWKEGLSYQRLQMIQVQAAKSD
jgi:uncharacterized protein (TIRG00374 family)